MKGKMKVNRETGAVTLGKNDVRLGNFVVTAKAGGYGVRPVSGLVEFFFSSESVMGRCLPMMLEEGNRRFCGAWIDALFFAASVVPDVEYLTDILNAAKAAVDRHPVMYGGTVKELSEREDRRVLKEEEKFREGLDVLKG